MFSGMRQQGRDPTADGVANMAHKIDNSLVDNRQVAVLDASVDPWNGIIQ